jgi:hypothetical protein
MQGGDVHNFWQIIDIFPENQCYDHFLSLKAVFCFKVATYLANFSPKFLKLLTLTYVANFLVTLTQAVNAPLVECINVNNQMLNVTCKTGACYEKLVILF